jgi:hypothetical protein
MDGKMVLSPGGDFMNPNPIVVHATLQPDGVTLVTDEPLPLSPGRVEVAVRGAAPPPSGPGMLEVLDRIHRDQRSRGHRPMSEAEMEAEIAALGAEKDEEEKRWRQSH